MKMIIFISVILIMNGCSKHSRVQKEISIQRYIEQNERTQENIYNEISSHIQRMKKDSLKSMLLNFIHESKIDNLIIFNKEQTKFYTTLNTSAKIYSHSTSDLIQSLYGVKIDGKWLVFIGHQNLIAMRDGYKYNKYEPFTWDEISFMAHEQMFGRYISIDKSGSLIINYDQLDKDTGVRELTGKIPGEYTTPEDAFISFNAEYYESQTLDSTEIAQIKEDIEAGKKKPKDPIKKVAWWDRLWGKEIPIFETDEWKAYVKCKNQVK